jgi:hypothetical protein
LIKRASTLQVELERMEGKLSQGEQVDLDSSRLDGILPFGWGNIATQPQDAECS